LWIFLAPALYPKEKKLVYYFVPLGTVAFILGDIFFLKLVWPLIISFSLRYESEFLYSMLNLTQFVNFCLRLLLLFGLIFELPLILLILARVGLVEVDFLRRQRRLAILLSAVVAAFHADLLTMTAIAIPLYGMYELSILGVRLFRRRGPELRPGAGGGPRRTGLGAGGPLITARPRICPPHLSRHPAFSGEGGLEVPGLRFLAPAESATGRRHFG
jgi:sec-independent protein translocase protein TatC